MHAKKLRNKHHPVFVISPARIRRLRAARHWTQFELADRLDVHRVTVARWELGEHHPTGLAARKLKMLGA